MKVKILEVESGELIKATIKSGLSKKLPSIQEGWRFNFNKHINKPNSKGFIIVKEETPEIIEGCLIFQMKEGIIPYMSFIEVAPHNFGNKKDYDYVAGCLIAYACKLSYIHGKQHHNGALTFDVKEENEVDEKKFKAIYCAKYGATEIFGRMEIFGENSENLIKKYLDT